MTVFSRGVPLNQVLFICLDICLQVLQVGTRGHLFTSTRYHLFTNPRCHLFTSTRCLCLHVFTMAFKFMYHHVLESRYHLFTNPRCRLFTSTRCLLFTRVYNGLQVHVSPRSGVTFGNDVALHKKQIKKVVTYYSHVLSIPDM